MFPNIPLNSNPMSKKNEPKKKKTNIGYSDMKLSPLVTLLKNPLGAEWG